MKPTGKLKFAYDSIANLEQKISRLEYENDDLKQCIEELVSTKVSLQRKALKAKTNIIKAQAIEDFKSYVKSGLKVLNEPSWQGKRPVVIDEKTYFEMTLSEFDDYANKLRGEK